MDEAQNSNGYDDEERQLADEKKVERIDRAITAMASCSDFEDVVKCLEQLAAVWCAGNRGFGVAQDATKPEKPKAFTLVAGVKVDSEPTSPAYLPTVASNIFRAGYEAMRRGEMRNEPSPN